MSFQNRLFLTTAVVLVLLLAWTLMDLLTLLFGSIVLATALISLAELLHRRLRIPARIQSAAAVAVVLAALAGLAWFLGDAMAGQFAEIQQRLPAAWQKFQDVVSSHPLGRQALSIIDLKDAGLVRPARIANVAGATLGAVGSTLLMAVLSLYLAFDPGLYRRGFLKLVPPAHRGRVEHALKGSGQALSLWLWGQGISMIFLGVCTAVGLALLGAPVPMALGLITGLLGFVPFLGSIGAGVLCALLSLTAGLDTAIYVALLFGLIQLAQEYVVAPAVQKWAVALPPALTLISALVFGLLLGPLGAVFATPMMVVARHLINTLYVQDILEARHPRPTRKHDDAPMVSPDGTGGHGGGG